MRARQEILILRGLPGAGKSTWAAHWLAQDPAARAVVNRDQLRRHLTGQYHGLTRDQEDAVTDLQRALADLAIREGRSVVVDDTNLHPDFVAQWEQFAHDRGVPSRVVVIDTPAEECLRRNRARGAAGGRFVPEAAILDMHNKAAAHGLNLPR